MRYECAQVTPSMDDRRHAFLVPRVKTSKKGLRSRSHRHHRHKRDKRDKYYGDTAYSDDYDGDGYDYDFDDGYYDGYDEEYSGDYREGGYNNNHPTRWRGVSWNRRRRSEQSLSPSQKVLLARGRRQRSRHHRHWSTRDHSSCSSCGHPSAAARARFANVNHSANDDVVVDNDDVFENDGHVTNDDVRTTQRPPRKRRRNSQTGRSTLVSNVCDSCTSLTSACDVTAAAPDVRRVPADTSTDASMATRQRSCGDGQQGDSMRLYHPEEIV